jgi:hypothetical protein
MGPPWFLRSVVDRNVVMRRMTVTCYGGQGRPLGGASGALAPGADFKGAPKKAVTDRPHVNT